MAAYHVLRKERELTDELELRRIIREAHYVSIAMCRDGEPYVVTLSHGFDESRSCLYFHAGLRGQKLDFLHANPAVCAMVIEDHGYVEGDCSHKYRSVVIRGTMSTITEEAEKLHAMSVLIGHQEQDPEPVKLRFLADPKWTSGVAMLRLDITGMTGKGNC